MEDLSKLESITKDEILYQLLKGLREVGRILKKYDRQPQLSTVEFTFMTKKEVERSGKVFIFIGFKKSRKKDFSTKETVKFTYSKQPSIAYKPVKFNWKEKGNNLYLEFAGKILRQIATVITANRKISEFSADEYTIEDTFLISNSGSGILELKLFSELFAIDANIDLKNTVSHSYKISFKTMKSKSVKKEIA